MKKIILLIIFFIPVMSYATPLNRERVDIIIKDIGDIIGLDPKKKQIDVLLDKLNINTEEEFNNVVSRQINKYGLWDRKEVYVMKWGDNDYPKPFIFDECINTNEEFIFYINKKVIKVLDKRSSRYIEFRYFYKDILCLIGDKNQKSVSNKDMLTKDFIYKFISKIFIKEG